MMQNTFNFFIYPALLMSIEKRIALGELMSDNPPNKETFAGFKAARSYLAIFLLRLLNKKTFAGLIDEHGDKNDNQLRGEVTVRGCIKTHQKKPNNDKICEGHIILVDNNSTCFPVFYSELTLYNLEKGAFTALTDSLNPGSKILARGMLEKTVEDKLCLRAYEIQLLRNNNVG